MQAETEEEEEREALLLDVALALEVEVALHPPRCPPLPVAVEVRDSEAVARVLAVPPALRVCVGATAWLREALRVGVVRAVWECVPLARGEALGGACGARGAGGRDAEREGREVGVASPPPPICSCWAAWKQRQWLRGLCRWGGGGGCAAAASG